MKKLLSLILALAFININVSAYELPHAFWKLNDAYVSAKNSGDLQGIIKTGSQIIDLIAGEPETQQVLEVRGSRLEQIAIAYEKLGDFPKSAEYFAKYAPVAAKLGWDDAVKICNAKVLQYSSDLRIYKESYSPAFSHHAKLEQEKGVLFGLTSDSPSAPEVPHKSMVLLYAEFGNSNTDWLRKVLNDARQNGQAVEFAWNIPGEGYNIGSVVNSRDHIISMLTLLEEYNTIPIYIRFGAEMNIWNNRTDPQTFIEAFRTVSTLAKQYTTNTAMVWSVNDVSAWDIEMLDYYPGDEYVDWVGVSLYMQKYFLGKTDWAEKDKFNEVVFLSGRNADPVKALNEVMTKFGNRKPIMISESGASHYIRTANEHDNAWAKLYLTKLYNYVPMVYPQVKLIAHFDKVIESETNDYALCSCPELLELYKELTDLPHFIHAGTDDNPVDYFELYQDYTEVSSNDELCTYTHIYADENPKVCYYIDGQWAGASTKLPYRFTGLSNVSGGEHTLKVAVETNGLVVMEKSIKLMVKKDISILINGNKIKSDTTPVISGGRTLVPIRVIANGLGSEVKWLADTREVVITRGGDTLILQIDNPEMTKNGEKIALDTAPRIIGGRTMVPVRAIGEAFGASVDWNGDSKTVIINK